MCGNLDAYRGDMWAIGCLEAEISRVRERFVPSATVRTNIIGIIEKHSDRGWYTKRRGAGEGYRVSCACFGTELADKLTKMGYK